MIRQTTRTGRKTTPPKRLYEDPTWSDGASSDGTTKGSRKRVKLSTPEAESDKSEASTSQSPITTPDFVRFIGFRPREGINTRELVELLNSARRLSDISNRIPNTSAQLCFGKDPANEDYNKDSNKDINDMLAQLTEGEKKLLGFEEVAPN